ncbi:MAG: phage major capsid protein [Pseudomonadota bacterium]
MDFPALSAPFEVVATPRRTKKGIAMILAELQERRAAKLAEMRQIQSAGNLDDEKRAAFDALEKEVDGLNGDITRAQRLAEFERTAENGTTITATPDFDREASQYSLTRALAYASGLNVDAAREREVSQEMEIRTGRKAEGIIAPDNVFHVLARPQEQRVVTTNSAGAGLVFEQGLPGQYIDALRANLVTGSLGATFLSGLTGSTVSIPKLNASAGSQWIAENEALTSADDDFDKVQMTDKTIGAVGEVSRSMLLQSSPDIEQLMRRNFAASLAVGVDAAALVGGGTNEPDGIITQLTAGPGLDSVATPTWQQILALIAKIELNNVSGSLGWAVNPRAVETLRSTPKIEYGSPPTDSMGGFIMDGPNELAGYQARSTTNLSSSLGSPATGTVIFGDWSSLLIGAWSGVDILANPYESTAYAKGNVQVRALMTMDVALRGTDRFAAATDIPRATS